MAKKVWILFFLLLARLAVGVPKYLVVDLAGGPRALSYPVQTLEAVPAKGWGEAYKGRYLVLRRIEAGRFLMGEQKQTVRYEMGARILTVHLGTEWRQETVHPVSLTRAYYIGVFELTQAQWCAVMGPRTFADFPGPNHPANRLSYEALRGAGSGAQWPDVDTPDPESFLGRLRAKTGLAFDLPTEAQWEYACRAGTSTHLYTGRNLEMGEKDPGLDKLGRYYYNGGEKHGTAPVGSYPPNGWGLYDLYGNVEEWCLDRQQRDLGTAEAVDPVGPRTGLYHALRGGSWFDSAQSCRSAARNFYFPTCDSVYFGARLVCPAE